MLLGVAEIVIASRQSAHVILIDRARNGQRSVGQNLWVRLLQASSGCILGTRAKSRRARRLFRLDEVTCAEPGRASGVCAASSALGVVGAPLRTFCTI